MNLPFRKAALAILLSFGVFLAARAVHAQDAGAGYAGKKILYVNSYHKGYGWSDGIEKGIVSVIGPSGAALRIQYMDTKNHPDEASRKQAGLDAKAVIDTWKPDVVITSDDNAVRYLILPYFKNSKIPFVFNGVNWDAEQYGFPCSNVTGMLEVDSTDQMIGMLKSMKPGATRVAVLAADTESEKLEVENHRKVFGIDYVQVVYAATFDDWKKSFVALQDKADILQLQNNAGIKGWDDDAAKAFVLANTKIPTGSIDGSYMSPFTLLMYAKVPEEQGEWSAKTALRILDGESVSGIPLSRNVRGLVYVNAPLFHKLGITIPPDVLNVANITK